MKPRRRARRHRMEASLLDLQAWRLGCIKRGDLRPDSEREWLFDAALRTGRAVWWPDYIVSPALFRAEQAGLEPPGAEAPTAS